MSKLVRDRIPEIISKSGVEPIWRKASEDEVYKLLINKLQEEVDELKAAIEHDHQLEECADIYEVLIAIITYLDLTKEDWSEWLQILLDKREERGTFKDRIILEGVKEK